MADQESELDNIRSQLASIELRLKRLEAGMNYSGAISLPNPAEKSLAPGNNPFF